VTAKRKAGDIRGAHDALGRNRSLLAPVATVADCHTAASIHEEVGEPSRALDWYRHAIGRGTVEEQFHATIEAVRVASSLGAKDEAEGARLMRQACAGGVDYHCNELDKFGLPRD